MLIFIAFIALNYRKTGMFTISALLSPYLSVMHFTSICGIFFISMCAICTRLVSFWFVHFTLHARTHACTHPFYGPMDFVRVYTGELVPKSIWILLKHETVSGSGISWAIYKSAPFPRQITMPALHRSVFYRPDALPAAQPTASKRC